MVQNSRQIDIREALREAIDEEMTRDESVFLMGEEVAEYNGAYKISKGLLDKWGDKRVIDTPISEVGFTGLCIGAAMTGLRPIVEFMSFNFSFVAFDQLVSHACKMYYMSGNRFSVPIVFRGPNGAAAQVSCQHSHNVEATYANFPGFVIIAPSNAYDAKGLLKAAIRNNNPVLFLENELDYSKKGDVPEGDYVVEIGKAKIVREGTDITLIAYSRMLHHCAEVVDLLAAKGISVELIDLRTIKPLDMGLIAQSVRKTNFCVVAEEGHYFSGIGAEVGFMVQQHCFDYLDAPVARVCQKETPLPYSKEMEKASQPGVESIKTAIEETLNLRR
ncbi:pyruvate dehydrogenase complex E1 component subunit beta [Candidatus Aerophobetes bacterium]|uniref:Pyruvate dehydrogenase complex E1 component subunit beta n=1 Tax=Aerophobetes bacterium TaxID=2030807 RepID=A0A2A4X6D6_UNCAE|nr:MAG: pyruvate dehydrogenase complex E1 component subunit beta [Candidatus Aerophobetes bacterium]